MLSVRSREQQVDEKPYGEHLYRSYHIISYHYLTSRLRHYQSDHLAANCALIKSISSKIAAEIGFVCSKTRQKRFQKLYYEPQLY